ncbi:hypothetical protein [Cyclobacterium amurskyense]|uniref:hypothetical protein n=1 Tax=Cyclobacterium amurskyense TaxID=320787 RepID=UPI00065E88F1|nr:hypothetical protein [Cyclobacterium amurskyense]|tara:strand:+ start:310 stop:510 length:201 start_codon:yes stop_codon:yes gene_type:complete
MVRRIWIIFLIGFDAKLKGPKLSNTIVIKASLSGVVRWPARQQGGDRPCWEGISAGLIFFASFLFI